MLFLGPARDASGVARDDVDGDTLGEVVGACVARYGEPLADVLRVSRVWLNGEAVDSSTPVSAQDEVAIVPPVSGG